MRFPEANLAIDERTEQTITRLLYLILFSGIVLVMAKNTARHWQLCFLCGLLVTSVTLRRALIYESSDHLALGKFNFLFDLTLILTIDLIDRSLVASIFYLVLMIDAALTYSVPFTGMITLAGFLLHGIARYSQFKPEDFAGFFSALLSDLLIFFGIYLLMTFMRYQIQQKEHLRQIMLQLKIKTNQLEITNQKLKATTLELEEVTVLRERNRIAREIHDTVGHTLTTVLLELEAGERLVPLDPAAAATKLKLAKGQIRKGLTELRSSVETLKSGQEMLEFKAAVKLLIHETMLHGEIHFRYQIDELLRLPPLQEKALYRALQEGITNGIRHGRSTAFVFNLKQTAAGIEFLLQDNGGGAERLVPGFGLSTMEARIKELGGSFKINSKLGEGCLIQIFLPRQEVVDYAG